MVTFRNNNSGRRNNFRRNDRNFKNNGIEKNKFSSHFSSSDNFHRKSPGRNNHNAPKLLEKYNDMAREALSTGDKILSENYFQHADHFQRIINERDNLRKSKFTENSEKKDIVEVENKDNKKLSNSDDGIETNEVQKVDAN
tara:strand:+ start:201 stop:623 length:423 start_codon:yes stop_codon:yes gene_type:complete